LSGGAGPPGPDATAAAKAALRRTLGARPVAPDPDADARLHARLAAQPGFRRAPRVALYADLSGEVAMRPLFESLRRAGRRCLFPRLAAGTRLEFAAVAHWDDLVSARFGLREPAANAPAERPGPSDWVLVPGLAFDAAGNRLGRGAGYYDRTFPPGDAAAPCLVGVARAERVLESVPCDSHDRAMDAIVTERAFRWTRGERE
jgi:5-formyltetrahydrofolate cyclo-ligase